MDISKKKLKNNERIRMLDFDDNIKFIRLRFSPYFCISLVIHLDFDCPAVISQLKNELLCQFKK